VGSQRSQSVGVVVVVALETRGDWRGRTGTGTRHRCNETTGNAAAPLAGHQEELRTVRRTRNWLRPWAKPGRPINRRVVRPQTKVIQHWLPAVNDDRLESLLAQSGGNLQIEGTPDWTVLAPQTIRHSLPMRVRWLAGREADIPVTQYPDVAIDGGQRAHVLVDRGAAGAGRHLVPRPVPNHDELHDKSDAGGRRPDRTSTIGCRRPPQSRELEGCNQADDHVRGNQHVEPGADLHACRPRATDRTGQKTEVEPLSLPG